ncbi:MAG: glycosyltransferase family 9 protein [Phycisphaeraceae bacterium]|nr:MAG: glycosyltransferase family 9 protein [Phycisphaeraceae bacterium]
MVPNAQRVLLIRPSALGDVCRSVPVLVSLRAAFQDARIDWLVRHEFAPAVAAHPALSRVVSFERGALGRSLASLRVGPTLEFLKSLRRERYSTVVDAQGLARSGLFAWATAAPRRAGFADARELGWIGLNERHRLPRGLHAVDRMLALVHAMGITPIHDMRLYTPKPDLDAFHADPHLAGRRYALLAPGSRWPGKRWPPDRFADLAQRSLEMGLDAVVVVGSPGERDAMAPLLDLARREPRLIDRVGRTSVGGLMALIQHAAVVVANDSAAVHIAVGFDRPLVALYGPTRVDLVGPYRRDADVIQHARPGDRLDHKDETAGRAMMERIQTAEVADRVDRVRDRSPHGPAGDQNRSPG